MKAVNRGNAVHYSWGGVCDGWRLLDGADLSVIEERIPPGAGETAHHHKRARQFFYVLAGELAMEMPGETIRLRPGDSLEVPPVIVHRAHNATEEEVSFLVMSAPSTQGDRIEDH